MRLTRGIRTWLLAASFTAASLTCSDDISDPLLEPALLVEAGGDGQVGPINSMLPEQLVVRVVDAEGEPVSGVEVEWTVSGGGSVSPSSVVSRNDGLAAVRRTLGGTAGAQTTTASAANLPPVVFTSTAEAGEVPRLVITTEPSATAETGVPLVRQPILMAEDGSGEPLPPGLAVTASVSDGATLSGTTTVASEGSTGLVQFTDLALSGPDGNYILTFTAPGVAGVQSAPIALGGTQNDRLVVTTQPSNAGESGVELTQQPIITAETAAGDPLGAGIPVTATVSDGATLGGTTVVETDGSGVAAFTDLALTGPDGNYTLTFSAPDLDPVESEPITLSTVSEEGGVWSEPFDWPIVAVHVMLLPTGEVLSIGRNGQPQVWSPESGTFTEVPAPANLFCSGHVLLSDGRVFVAGGHIDIDTGLPNITFFSGGAWSSGTPMPRGRWYPTTTVLGNGDVLILAGRDEVATDVPIPDVWSNGSLRQLTGASHVFPYYPRAFLAPDGSVYVAGATEGTRFLSLSGNGSWRAGPRRPGGARNYGSAVMYDDGKILYAGGAYTTNTAETIDLNQASPSWQATGSMAFARRHLNLTVLPTGEVLATGGVAGTTFNDMTRPVRAAELWNPATGQWTTLASSAITRGYHATSLLLPDGQVLHAGSGDGGGAPRELNAELFSPPYLFRGARPQITSAPTEVRYGDQFRVLTPQAGAITQVSLIRLGAVTHAFDQNQRFQRLTFSADATGLTVTAPSSPNRAPPGHYMLFILNEAGVPSVGQIVRIF